LESHHDNADSVPSKDSLSENPLLEEDSTLDKAASKKKTLSTSSVSSTSSTISTVTTSSTSASSSIPPSISEAESESDIQDKSPISDSSLSQQFHESDPSPSPPSSSSSVPSNDVVTNQTESQEEDIKEVEIETENPSHLFWVPFHLHPEIAPNEYNNWLSKRGVDSNGGGGILAARKESVNRRKSVLSSQFNPYEDEDEESDDTKPMPTTILEEQSVIEHDIKRVASLSESHTRPNAPLKTRTSIRRKLSSPQSPQPQPHTEKQKMDSDTDKTAGELANEDIIMVKRGSGLTRHGPSLLRRSARTKIRRESNASSDIKNDVSRLRSEMIENGEYPAVTLVDPGPIPLTSSSSSSSSPSSTLVPQTEIIAADAAGSEVAAKIETPVRADLAPRQLKRFVSTLRDSSKPTITTYIEPQLLEQRQRDLESSSKSLEALASLTIADVSQVNSKTTVSSKPTTSVSYDSAVASKITFPIPPPVKLNQNLLQQPAQPAAASRRPSVSSQPPTKKRNSLEIQPNSANGHITTQTSKKSMSWSWLWGKEKGGDKALDVAQRLNQVSSSTNPQPQLHDSPVQTETAVKKQSTLSLLFSRNGKSSTKSQTGNNGSNGTLASNGASGGQNQDDYLSDSSRMPIHIERAIYRLSHVKLANVRRPLHEQVMISNMMFWYLGVIQQQQQQQQQQKNSDMPQQPAKSQTTQVLSEHDAKTEGKESIQAIPSKQQKSLKKKRSQQEASIPESKVESSEYHIPQQDSNSHARSPGKDLATTIFNSVSREEEEYDEEEMIGGFGEFNWDGERESHGEGGAGPLYLQARGPKKHLKRLNAPKHWMLDKLTGTYAPRPTAGPHKLRECLPLIILLRNRLKYALNGKEVSNILMQRLIKVDGKVRTDTTFPAGFMDVISIEKTGENFRLVYDTKGRFTVHRITAEEAKYKLCKVKKVQLGSKGIPFVVTHDGRTIRYPDPLVKVNDTIKLDLEAGKFTEFVKFDIGNVAMVTGGRNTGRVGVITHKERHVGGFDIVHIKDVLDRQFATRLSNVFVI
ncbi:40S ribosomal protein S4, partial [Entomortierella beljakovae]